MADSFRHLVERLAADPHRPVAELLQLGPKETEVQLRWGTGPSRPVEPATIVGMLAAATAAHPDAPALAGARSLTYAELSGEVARAAATFRTLGVERGRAVLLRGRRSPDYVISLLAVLQAGGVFVPIATDWPLDRLRQAIGATDPVLALVDEPVEGLGVPQLAMSGFGRAAAGAASPPPSPGDIAYTIFTSGSTGEPKGVCVRHDSLANQVAWFRRTFALGPGSRVLARTAFWFDASIWEIFATLAGGGLLVVADDEEAVSAGPLNRLLKAQQVTHLQCAPSLLTLLLSQGALAGAALQWLYCGGEALTPTLARAAASATGARIVNLYGPTEATVQIAWSEVDTTADVVPIGRPIDNARLLVLDDARRPVPAGLPGELWIVGLPVAAGYAGGRVDGGFAADPGGGLERAYRTGDVVRWLADGQLAYLGRNDTQVKVRGQRIELGETEAALVAQPEIAGAVAHFEPVSGGTITAFVTARDGCAVDVTAVREALGRRLPPAGVPTGIVVLPELPLLSNGKVDRAAISRLASSVRPAEAAVRGDLGQLPAPVREIGERLAKLWDDVTGEPQGGGDVAYVQAGNSLLLLVYRYRIEAEFGIGLSLAQLHECETVGRLSRLVADELGRTEASKPAATGLDERYLTELLARHEAPGLAVATYDGAEERRYLIGLRDRDAKLPMTGDTAFRATCFSKVLTAMLVMALEGQGLLDIQSTVGEICPDPAFGPGGRHAGVKLIHLLTHSAGFDESNLSAIHADSRSIREFAAKTVRYPRMFPPGEGFIYSTASSVILAHIVERVTGRVWMEALRSFIFAPLGIDPNGGTRPRSYVRDEGGGLREAPDPQGASFLGPSASREIHLTAGDLMRLARMVFCGGRSPDGQQILTAEGAALMTRRHVTVRGVHYLSGWGIGWLFFPADDLVGFITGAAGQDNLVCFSPKQNKLLVVQVNFHSGLALFEEVVQRYFGLTLIPRSAGRTFRLADTVGAYAADGVRVEISREEEKVFCTLRKRGPDGRFAPPVRGEILPSGLGDYYIPNPEHPLKDALNFADFDPGGRPTIVRTPSLVCKRRNDPVPDRPRVADREMPPASVVSALGGEVREGVDHPSRA